VVVGPKDLPKMLRTFGRTTAKLRAMAGDFQKQFNEALREAELDDVKKSVEKAKSLGATVMKDKTEVKDMGSFAIINDPTGAMLGLWETKKH